MVFCIDGRNTDLHDGKNEDPNSFSAPRYRESSLQQASEVSSSAAARTPLDDPLRGFDLSLFLFYIFP